MVKGSGASRDRRAKFTHQTAGSPGTSNGWCRVAKHMQGDGTVLADDISVWPENRIHDRVIRPTKDNNLKEQDIDIDDKRQSNVAVCIVTETAQKQQDSMTQ